VSKRPVTRRNHAVWIGALISLVGLISYFTFFARFPALRDVPKVNFALVLIGLAVSAWGLLRRRSLWSIGGFALSAACAGLLAAYVFVLSYGLPDTELVIQVGDAAPAFALPDQEGRTTALDDYRGSSLVLVFYRGFW
jgi:FtsH-binding integral membrane protein